MGPQLAQLRVASLVLEIPNILESEILPQGQST